MVAAALGLVCLAVPLSWPQDGELEDPAEDSGLLALGAQLEVERRLLEEDLGRYRVMTGDRQRVLDRLSELYRELDDAVADETEEAAERLERLTASVQQAEADRAELRLAERSLVERVRERRRRIALLDEELAALEGHVSRVAGVLTGTWDLVLLPMEQRGIFELKQSGTLITGTYRLSGGWSGSLQGTLIERKVHLVRIDSKLGRSMELDGFLSSDGRRIRGGWLNYELAGGDGATGQWSALKR